MNIKARLEYELAYYDSAGSYALTITPRGHPCIWLWYTTRRITLIVRISFSSTESISWAEFQRLYIYIYIWFLTYHFLKTVKLFQVLLSTPLKLVDKFTYLGSSVASTEKDIDTRLTKAWIAINRLSTIWKSDLTDKNKTQFLPGSGRIDTAIWMHYMDSKKTAGEEARRQLHKNAANNLEQVLVATPHKTPTVRPPASYHESYSRSYLPTPPLRQDMTQGQFLSGV